MAKKILVVDDDPVIVKYIVKIFNDNGYETCTASDGVEAMDQLKAEKPALVTLDLEMHEEWGPRFYRKLTKDPDHKDTPVVVISGLSASQYAIKNAVASLNKPFDPDELMEIVKKTIGAP
jgi:CheY-like chemotaxis protein